MSVYEVTPSMVAEWGAVEPYCGSLRQATGGEDFGARVEAAHRHRADLHAQARRLFENFAARL